MLKRMIFSLGILVLVVGLAVPAHATLADMNDGTIYDTDTQLSWLKDTQAGGGQSFAGANTWLATLNAGSGFAGFTNWRLPIADPSCGSMFNCSNSEMGHLYYTELGNVAGSPSPNTGPFTNFIGGYRWTGTDYSLDTTQAWGFQLSGGSQAHFPKGSVSIAWAVRPGARTLPGATPVGYNPAWFIATLVSLMGVGGLLLRRRIVR